MHKLTTQLVRENQTIVVEDLAIKNMVKNHKLALSISDASWGELIRQLAYKCEWYGRELIKIDRWFPSSKSCGNCGHIEEDSMVFLRDGSNLIQIWLYIAILDDFANFLTAKTQRSQRCQRVRS